ncbi:MAG: hypothetical protein H6Q07_1464 [Acidobacteria bacterium]|nr:hypothetical protein [Acidobacteriota bacterium]
MNDISYEVLKKRISENLNARLKEFGKTVGDISRNFRNLELEAAVWYPDKIHSTNLGGIVADSYFGYSRIEGKWGLVIRTIERDIESRAYVSQRVYTIDSCRNAEIAVNALKKAKDLLLLIEKATDRQLEVISGLDDEMDALRRPDGKF